MTRHDVVELTIRDRLLNKSKETRRPFVEILQYYCMERFLYRLSISDYLDRFFLKGGLMFRAWAVAEHRPTLDIDFLAKTKNTVENLEKICRNICVQNSEDGLHFRPNTVKGREIQFQAEYRGVRLEFQSVLEKSTVHMQIDVGFGDIISPEPASISYPTILGFPSFSLLGYTPESVIAEKFEALVKRGMFNSRMKDIFDIWFLSREFVLSGSALSAAIASTFNQRNTVLQEDPECFSRVFVMDALKIMQWQSFIRKNSPKNQKLSLNSVMTEIKAFLSPVVIGILNKNLQKITWRPFVGWDNLG